MISQREDTLGSTRRVYCTIKIPNAAKGISHFHKTKIPERIAYHFDAAASKQSTWKICELLPFSKRKAVQCQFLLSHLDVEGFLAFFNEKKDGLRCSIQLANTGA
jgi:hypothetical protein